ncbi:hypothetical protein N865_15915 [Intrasporangium oryzae NRRL B-24470]|uniref:HNH nuclease domain-containing protein n=1 Tax=Intrasporangium oryzae NRRL B-24470 TaxID=1386089 RepID=W9G964_9MICO|nr:DUF222 domain-containing protein [Intrasporangium oryzae]EWT00404.1 hypothetical protein N865_15915 [Intrasporangium oryzae NRRL B-24470]
MPARRPVGRGVWAELDPDAALWVDPLRVTSVDPETLDLDGADAGWVPDGPGEPGRPEPVGVMVEAVVGMHLTRHAEDELVAAAEHVASLRADHDVMLVNVLAELEARGAEPPGGLSRVDWLRAHDPGLTAAAARAFVTVARAVNEPRWAVLRTRVSMQHVSVAKAAQIVGFHERTHLVADPVELDEAIDDLTAQAPVLRAEELARLVRHHTEQITPPPDHDRIDEGRRQARGLWFAQPNATGMVRMHGLLDPEAAAVIRSAVDPLSRPCPSVDERGRTLEPDPRSPAKRRADALVEVVARGVSSPDGVSTTDKAKVVVTIDHDVLTGRLEGAGVTASGDVLSAATVRRLACDAAIVPMVLGSESEPLDVGREKRLVTRGLRLALITRDRGCTFPGCSIPAQWTDAHHNQPWFLGGTTSLLTTTLLCRRHHTHVHQHGLVAAITAAHVTWHV